MRFQITMNMPARSGNFVHQVIADHPAASLEEFHATLNREDFILVDEIYKTEVNGGPTRHSSQGGLILNTVTIGKVKIYREETHHRR